MVSKIPGICRRRRIGKLERQIFVWQQLPRNPNTEEIQTPFKRTDCASDDECADYSGLPKSEPSKRTLKNLRKPFIGLSITRGRPPVLAADIPSPQHPQRSTPTPRRLRASLRRKHGHTVLTPDESSVRPSAGPVILDAALTRPSALVLPHRGWRKDITREPGHHGQRC